MVSEKDGVTLVLLVWNEVDAVQKLLEMVPFDAVDETIVMDPGSTDGTIEFLKSKGLPVHIQKQRGRGNAFIEAKQIAKYDNIIFFSGDGNEDPRDIPKMAELLKQGYDLVIAGRFLLPGSESDDSDDPLRIRKWGNITYGKIVDLFWQSHVKDAINGFRGMKKSAMEKMKLDAPKHEIELQSTIRAAKLGLKIKEFPTKELKRLGGDRKPTAGTWTLGYRIGAYLLREVKLGKKF